LKKPLRKQQLADEVTRAPEWPNKGEMGAASHCPRWHMKLRFPASDEDRRGVFEIPTAMLASTATGSSITVLVRPDDPSLGVAYDLLNAAEVAGNQAPVLLHLCGQKFCLSQKEMQIEFLASLRAFLIGIELDIPVDTSAPDTLQ
jgi:hypothetical protein